MCTHGIENGIDIGDLGKWESERGWGMRNYLMDTMYTVWVMVALKAQTSPLKQYTIYACS